MDEETFFSVPYAPQRLPQNIDTLDLQASTVAMSHRNEHTHLLLVVAATSLFDSHLTCPLEASSDKGFLL